jgi:hypothetical protein
MLEMLSTRLMDLEQELRDDERGADDLRRTLEQLEREHLALTRATDKARQVLDDYESGAQAAFKTAFDGNMLQTHQSYQLVQDKHKHAMGIIGRPDTFGYHPSYKRHDDKFSANNFTPRTFKRPEPQRSAREKAKGIDAQASP